MIFIVVRSGELSGGWNAVNGDGAVQKSSLISPWNVVQGEGEVAFGRVDRPAGVGGGSGSNQNAVLENAVGTRPLRARGRFPRT